MWFVVRDSNTIHKIKHAIMCRAGEETSPSVSLRTLNTGELIERLLTQTHDELGLHSFDLVLEGMGAPIDLIDLDLERLSMR